MITHTCTETPSHVQPLNTRRYTHTYVRVYMCVCIYIYMHMDIHTYLCNIDLFICFFICLFTCSFTGTHPPLAACLCLVSAHPSLIPSDVSSQRPASRASLTLRPGPAAPCGSPAGASRGGPRRRVRRPGRQPGRPGSCLFILLQNIIK